MQQFLLVAAAHFLALLSPGPDFFLIARTSARAGWRVASAACLGIALANGVFIVAAFAGVSALRPDDAPFAVLQLAGCAYLLYVGSHFIRAAGGRRLEAGVHCAAETAASSWRAAGLGFLSAILNPKNALFYVSLAAMLNKAGTNAKILYGAWMFGVVLEWDVLIAALIGNPLVLRRFSRALPDIERASGVFLILLAAGVATALVARVAGG
jgi:threonine/homoserine/homoserine lactone efflux protein